MIDRSNYFSGRREIYKRGELQIPMLKWSKVSRKNRRKYYEKKRNEIKETYLEDEFYGENINVKKCESKNKKKTMAFDEWQYWEYFSLQPRPALRINIWPLKDHKKMFQPCNKNN